VNANTHSSRHRHRHVGRRRRLNPNMFYRRKSNSSEWGQRRVNVHRRSWWTYSDAWVFPTLRAWNLHPQVLRLFRANGGAERKSMEPNINPRNKEYYCKNTNGNIYSEACHCRWCEPCQLYKTCVVIVANFPEKTEVSKFWQNFGAIASLSFPQLSSFQNKALL
jgi:hypothetical protein